MNNKFMLSNSRQTKRVYIVWFHFNEILEQANLIYGEIQYKGR